MSPFQRSLRLRLSLGIFSVAVATLLALLLLTKANGVIVLPMVIMVYCLIVFCVTLRQTPKPSRYITQRTPTYQERRGRIVGQSWDGEAGVLATVTHDYPPNR
jgi:cell division protein FtsW (lipid II flippase)